MTTVLHDFNRRPGVIIASVLALTLAHLVAVLATGAALFAAATGSVARATTSMILTGVIVCPIAAAAGALVAAHAFRDRIRAVMAGTGLDPLTGLPNRAIVDELIDEATKSGTPMTVALVDVDGLHAVNANLGHPAGDAYLGVIAARLRTAVPDNGVLARQSGDEFTLLAPGTDPGDLAAAIRTALVGLTDIGAYRLQPRASVGIAATEPIQAASHRPLSQRTGSQSTGSQRTGPRSTGSEHTGRDRTGPADVRRKVDARHARARADSALYTAKREGGNRIRIFDPHRDVEPSPDGTRPFLRRRDLGHVTGLDTGLAWQATPGDDLIPVLLAPDDLRMVARSVAAAHDRWTQAAASGAADAVTDAIGGAAVGDAPATADDVEGQRGGHQRLLERLQRLIDASAPAGSKR